MIIRPRWSLVAVTAAVSSLATWALVGRTEPGSPPLQTAAAMAPASARAGEGFLIGGNGACPVPYPIATPSVTLTPEPPRDFGPPPGRSGVLADRSSPGSDRQEPADPRLFSRGQPERSDGSRATVAPLLVSPVLAREAGQPDVNGLEPSLGGITVGERDAARSHADQSSRDGGAAEDSRASVAQHAALTAGAAAMVAGMGGQPTAAHALSTLVLAIASDQEYEPPLEEDASLGQHDELENATTPGCPEPDPAELAELTRALERDPANVTALNNLAILYTRKPEMAPFSEALFGLLESLEPGDARVRANLDTYKAHRAGLVPALEFGRAGNILTVTAPTGSSHAVASRN